MLEAPQEACGFRQGDAGGDGLEEEALRGGAELGAHLFGVVEDGGEVQGGVLGGALELFPEIPFRVEGDAAGVRLQEGVVRAAPVEVRAGGESGGRLRVGICLGQGEGAAEDAPLCRGQVEVEGGVLAFTPGEGDFLGGEEGAVGEPSIGKHQGGAVFLHLDLEESVSPGGVLGKGGGADGHVEEPQVVLLCGLGEVGGEGDGVFLPLRRGQGSASLPVSGEGQGKGPLRGGGGGGDGPVLSGEGPVFQGEGQGGGGLDGGGKTVVLPLEGQEGDRLA